MTKCLKESMRRNCFQCIGACVKGGGGAGKEGIKPKIPPCREEYGYFLGHQVYWLDHVKHAILYSYLKEDLVRQVLEEMKILFEQNQKEV